MDRVRTGVEGLDQLLYGGFLRGDAILVAGAPGTGKTSLGMQFIYKGITEYQEPGIFITFEEFPERIYRDAKSFGWDFPALENQGKLKVLFISPEVLQQDIVRDHGLVTEMIHEIGARRVVVDSLSNLQDATGGDVQFREAVYGLVNALRRESLTAMLTQEMREHEDIGSGPEQFVADAVVRLTRAYVGGHHMRYIEVIKSRGSPQVAAASLYFVSEGGITVIPPFQEPLYRFEESVSTGFPQLDDLLGGGIPYGAFYLMEIDSDISQDLLDIGFAREALDTGDTYVRLACPSNPSSRWRTLLSPPDEQRLQQGIDNGHITMICPEETACLPGAVTCETLCTQMEAILKRNRKTATRIQVDISRLFSILRPEERSQMLSRLVGCCQQGRAVLMGIVSPRAIPVEQLEKLRTGADGIVRLWNEGSYSFIQVLKTVNSARTPVYAVRQVAEPPFLHIFTD